MGMPSRLSRLASFLKPTVAKVVGAILIALVPVLASTVADLSLSTIVDLTYEPASSQQALRDLEQMNSVMQEIQPQIAVLEGNSGLVEHAARASEVIQWMVSLVAAYLVAALLVERPRLGAGGN